MSRLRSRLLMTVAAGMLPVLTAAAAHAVPLPTLPKGWFVSGEAVYGWRSTGDAGQPIILQGTGPSAIYSAGGIGFHASPAIDLHAGYAYKNWALEARFFGGFHWKQGKDFGATGPFTIGDLVIGTPSADLGAVDDSHLDTYEFNARYTMPTSLDSTLPPITVFAGVRALGFGDSFIVNANPYPTASFVTHTHAVGPQVGAETRFGVTNDIGFEMFYVNLDARGGVLFENNRQSFSAVGGLLNTSRSNSASTASGFAEAGLSIGHRIGPYSLEAGYRLFYVDRIATGEGYAAESTADGSESGPPAYHSLLVQALTIGVKGKF